MIIFLMISLANFAYLAASAQKYEFITTDPVESPEIAAKNITPPGPSPRIDTDPFTLERLFGKDIAIGVYNPGSEEALILTGQAAGGSGGTGLSLGDLFVLDRLFRDSGVLEESRTTLGDLFILDQLFNNNRIFTDSNLDTGDLFILDRLFREENFFLSRDSTTLGDLFILNRLFGENR